MENDYRLPILLLMPLVQRWAVQLPPMLGLISVLIFAAWCDHAAR